MTIAELIAELSQYDPNDKVAYAYVTYKGRKPPALTGDTGD